jgi:hypothetical protein
VTEAAARRVANVVLVSAGIAAAALVASQPPLRRLASGLLRRWLGASLSVYLLNEARTAWAASGRRPGVRRAQER